MYCGERHRPGTREELLNFNNTHWRVFGFDWELINVVVTHLLLNRTDNSRLASIFNGYGEGDRNTSYYPMDHCFACLARNICSGLKGQNAGNWSWLVISFSYSHAEGMQWRTTTEGHIDRIWLSFAKLTRLLWAWGYSNLSHLPYHRTWMEK